MHYRVQLRAIALRLSLMAGAALLFPVMAQQPPQPAERQSDQLRRAPQRPAPPSNQPPGPGGDSIKISTDLVLLDVIVIDQNHQPVFDLAADDFTVADYAHEKGQRRRKALVIITDGLERDSATKEREVVEAIQEDEVQLYLVGFLEAEESGGLFRQSPAKKAPKLLVRLAEDSGGRAFFPQSLEEMPAIAAQIAQDLRTQYVISDYPTNDRRSRCFPRRARGGQSRRRPEADCAHAPGLLRAAAEGECGW